MPRKNQPRTLEKLCIDSATEMLCHLNESNVTNDFPWLLNKWENPFFSLPNSLLKTIIQNFCSSLYNNRRIYCKKKTFLILFCQKMDEIDLSRFNFAAKDYLDILDWLEKMSSDVKYFQDKRYENITAHRRTRIQAKLIKLISSMNSLTHLVLITACNNRFLDAVGKVCPNIIHLEANCDNITDLGLQSLWMNVNDPSDKTRRCQNIESLQLNFYLEDVTDDGIKMLLKNLPRLKFFNRNSLFSNYRPSIALIQMHEEDYMMCEQIYQLKEFSYNRLHYNSEEIAAKVPKILSKIAPYITTLRIEDATTEELIQFGQLKHLQNLTLNESINIFENGILPYITTLRIDSGTTEELIQFGQLKHVQNLTLINDYHESRNRFENGILLLLEKIGSNLRSLDVCVKEMKDLLAIGSLCPKLEKFTCQFSKFNSSYPTLNYHRVFQNLKILEFYYDDSRPLETTYLRKILRNCEELKTLILNGLIQLTEDDLVEMIKEDLPSVEHLEITCIPRISVSSVEDLLFQENDLKTFKLTSGTYFNEETLTRIKEIIKENNLNLCFKYHYY